MPILEPMEGKFRLNFWPKEYNLQIVDSLEGIVSFSWVKRFLNHCTNKE